MKNFLRIITLLGVLLIIGSCSSSKSVNVDDIYNDDGYIYVTLVQKSTDDTTGYVYTLNSDVTIISIPP